MRSKHSLILIPALALLGLAAGLTAKAETPAGKQTLGSLMGMDQPASPAAQTAASGTAAVSPTVRADNGPTEPVFLDGGTAVVYQVSEHIFGHENNVTGRNQAVTVTVEAQGELRRVVVSAAANAFKSDRSMRDSRVSGTLGGSKHPLVISTDWMPALSLTALTQGDGHLYGTLEIKGRPAGITLTSRGDGKTVQVQALTSFKDLGLDPPAMMLMGEVHQPLTLSAQIVLQQVQGLK